MEKEGDKEMVVVDKVMKEGYKEDRNHDVRYEFLNSLCMQLEVSKYTEVSKGYMSSPKLICRVTHQI